MFNAPQQGEAPNAPSSYPQGQQGLPRHRGDQGPDHYKWTTRPGGRGKGIIHRSATYPKPQQLTSSDFLIQVYDLQDRLDALAADENLESERDSIAEDIRALGEEQQEKLDNMPEGLQQGSTGEMLQERIDGCEAWADEIESVEIPEPPEEDDEDAGDKTAGDEDDEDVDDDADPEQDHQDALDSALEEIQQCAYQGP